MIFKRYQGNAEKKGIDSEEKTRLLIKKVRRDYKLTTFSFWVFFLTLIGLASSFIGKKSSGIDYQSLICIVLIVIFLYLEKRKVAKKLEKLKEHA